VNEAGLIADIMKGLVRLRSVSRTQSGAGRELPRELAAVKARLDQVSGDAGNSKRLDQYDIFYRLGTELHGRREPMSMGELSRALSIPLSSATRMVDWQVESGYIERLSDPKDRRIVRVRLTKEGRRLYQHVGSFLQGRFEYVLSEFPEGERETVIRLMQRLVEVFGEIHG
jgi:DNA-binding MarR family transcriptional regulator